MGVKGLISPPFILWYLDMIIGTQSALTDDIQGNLEILTRGNWNKKAGVKIPSTMEKKLQ